MLTKYLYLYILVYVFAYLFLCILFVIQLYYNKNNLFSVQHRVGLKTKLK